MKSTAFGDAETKTKRPGARFPAAFSKVVGVSALDKALALAKYSNTSDDPQIDGLAAFGGQAELRDKPEAIAMPSGAATWPVIAGSYEVGDPQGPVAICALTTESLIAPLARLPGVAIAGKVYTANLGITRIVLNVTANPAIRFLLICGKDSPLFHPAQSLVALLERGVDAERRIVGAIGYEPVLSMLDPALVEQFRQQVEVVDWAGEEDLQALEEGIESLVARNPGRFAAGDGSAGMLQAEERFMPIRPGGVREPLQYDPKGYFVITPDREQEQLFLDAFADLG